MPKISEKKKFLKHYTAMALNELCWLHGEKDEEKKTDEILEDLTMVLCAEDTCRYFMPFIRCSVPKSSYFICQVLPNLDEIRFKQFTRVSWKMFNKILELIKDDDVFNGVKTGKHFPVETQLAVVLYRLGSSGEGATIAKIGSLFGIGDSGTIQFFTNRVFHAILKLKEKYMFWLSPVERKRMVEATSHELPHCIGYVDGSEVRLAEKPMQDPEAFFSRKHAYSIKVQAVCDHKLRIRHLIVGYPGSVHDARIFNNSDLALKPEEYFSEEEWIAGDSAYKLTSNVLTPFRHTRCGAAYQNRRRFNKTFSRYRVRIEHCFMFLKERFSSLKELKIAIKNDNCTKKACLWILVCAILHNIILEEDEADEWPIENSVNSEESNENQDRVDFTVQGEAKRQHVMDLLNI